MFEKSLYDLIRGLRNHKGNERAYIQDSIRECRREIRTQDMDVKATALLKLTYLEMFGHDMSWASFNVLEVMSSQKYIQKRVGYLAAVQSFRPDTEVLMLAENQLKKDLSSPLSPTISLPLVAIPHLLDMSMANSLLSDLLPRLSHSNPIIRKKTIVTLYRLALVYPETLRPTWPKIKERLHDESEDPSVTAAVVNVVCELGWRRSQDFLPLAPRLFDLLVEGGNNWMAIKIIKLFAILTPLEPRLVKKLLPPLTNIIKTTPAMSLLYECINGIISGGILTSTNESTESDEIARLCVSKLQGMLTIGGDPNLKYVALLALERIVEHHPYLVSLHEYAILECIDHADVSIRLRALDLAAGIVTSHNLIKIVDRLMGQLQASPLAAVTEDVGNDRAAHNSVEPYADSDDEKAAQNLQQHRSKTHSAPLIPDDYRSNATLKIIAMCSQNNYVNINDFAWYINILVSLVRHMPVAKAPSSLENGSMQRPVAEKIGNELQNVAVRVKSCRGAATRAAETLLSVYRRPDALTFGDSGCQPVLGSAAWIVGEYASHLADPQRCMEILTHVDGISSSSSISSTFVQAAMKVFASIVGDQTQAWSPEWKTNVVLSMSRLIHFLENLTTHPNLETQETAVEFLELLRLANEATSHSVVSAGVDSPGQAPVLLTQAVPSLFTGAELNPVAPDAQQKVPLPDEINLDQPINLHLNLLLSAADLSLGDFHEDVNFYEYYHRRSEPREPTSQPAADRLSAPEESMSYQDGSGNAGDARLLSQRPTERQAQLRDDPFYISGQRSSGTVTPVHEIIRSSNWDGLDVDSIPIMELDLEDVVSQKPPSKPEAFSSAEHPASRKQIDVLTDENIDRPESGGGMSVVPRAVAGGSSTSGLGRMGFLQVDSSGLGSLSLSEKHENGDPKASQLDIERREAEEAEMTRAMKEVERLRLEMQRAQERIEARSEMTVVKKKRRKKKEKGGMEGGVGDAAIVSEISPQHPDDTAGRENSANTNTTSETQPITKKTKKKKTKSRDSMGQAGEQDNKGTAEGSKKSQKRREVVFG